MKEFLGYFFSPFVRPKIKFYFGRIAIGTPYFYPRRTVKDPDRPGYLKFVNKKIGFDVVKLGWKTKWSDSDFRFEWSPLISFVFLKWQFALQLVVPEKDHYWESWLYYQNKTDKSKSKYERAIQCQKEFQQIYKVSKNGKSTIVDFYNVILKNKYRLKSIDEVRQNKLESLLK